MVLNKESDSMSANEYLRAQKLGEKRYQAAVAKNEYPYLPVLDEIISPSVSVNMCQEMIYARSTGNFPVRPTH